MRPLSTTCAPAPDSACAIAQPRPRDEPVTSATFPASENISSMLRPPTRPPRSLTGSGGEQLARIEDAGRVEHRLQPAHDVEFRARARVLQVASLQQRRSRARPRPSRRSRARTHRRRRRSPPSSGRHVLAERRCAGCCRRCGRTRGRGCRVGSARSARTALLDEPADPADRDAHVEADLRPEGAVEFRRRNRGCPRSPAPAARIARSPRR